MGGFRPWFVDAGPANNSDKLIQLFQSAAKNERVANIKFMADVAVTVAVGQGAQGPTALSVASIEAIFNKLVSSVKLIVSGKTLFTLTGAELLKKAMHKTRDVPTNPFMNADGSGIDCSAWTNGSTYNLGKMAIPYHFNQPLTKFPSLLAPGVAQLFNAALTWTRGDQTAAITIANNVAITLSFTNVRLVASFAFEKGYYCAPLATIDKINLANLNTPIPGGYTPNVLNTTPASSSATGEIKSYSTPYGEEIHGVTPLEVAASFNDDGQTIYDGCEDFFTPYKYLPKNAEVDEFLPSPNGENLEITATAVETILCERYLATNEFIGPIVANLGDIIKGKNWQTVGLPGIANALVPTEYMPYMPKRLVD